ncbi:MAG: M28 family peptidase [Microcoleaceae cyanobacterium]
MKRLIIGCFFVGVLVSWLVWGQPMRYLRVVSAFPEQSNVQAEQQPRSNTPGPIPNPAPVVSSFERTHVIDPDRIWEYLEALVGERDQEQDRAWVRDYLANQLEKFGLMTTFQSFEGGVNLIAQSAQSETSAVTDQTHILVAAHYDTVFNSPGADDNASGLAVLLELARLFGSESTSNRLELVFFDREEDGLLGSLAFTSQAENLKNLTAAIVLDMVGYACYVEGCQTYPSGLNVDPFLQRAGIQNPRQGEFLAVVGELENRALLERFQAREQNRKTLPVVLVPVPLKGVLTPDVLRSDHAAFWYQQIPAVLVTDTANLRSPHYHQPSDTLANLDRDFLIQSAQFITDVVSQLLMDKSF